MALGRLCWPYAESQTSAFSEEILKSSLGSGPRGRRFKSSRPDHSPRKIQRKSSVSRRRFRRLWVERRAKLFGLDAPTEFSGPEGSPVPIIVQHIYEP
jgi:hypothetical protein